MTARRPPPRRFYLNGIDWNVQAMNRACADAPGGDYQFLIVTELAGTPDAARLRTCLNRLQERFPLLHGRLRRHPFNLAPYWEAPAAVTPYDLLTVADLSRESDPEAAAHRHLTARLNTPFAPDGPKLAALLLTGPDRRSRLALHFDHRLFDAAGGERFLTLLDRLWNGVEPEPERLLRREGPWLNEWRHQFACGRTVNRAMIALKKEGRPAVPGNGRGGAGCFLVNRVDDEEFAALEARADREAGPMMLTPFLAATFLEALHEMFRRRGVTPSFCVCPMTVNLRRGDEDEMFFNRWSILPLYSVSTAAREERIAQQVELFFEGMKTALPYSLGKASLLCRPLPLPLMARFTARPFAGTAGTAAFAYLNRTECAADRLLGETVTGLYHVPRVPPSPGLGLFLNRRGNRLNLTLSWTEETISDDERDLLAAAIPEAARGG